MTKSLLEGAGKLKIVFIAYLHGFGGAEKMIISVANAMAQREHNVTLISLVAHEECYQINPRINRIYVNEKGSNRLFKIYNRFFQLKQLLKEIKPDLLVNFWLQSAYLTAIYSKKMGFKNIYSERGNPGDKEYGGFLAVIRRMTFQKLDGFVFQSKAARNYFDKKLLKHSYIIQNPVSVDKKLCRNSSEIKRTIVSVGRLHPQKNQELLIEAFKLVIERFPDCSLEIYGEGELKEELLNKIDKLGLSGRAKLMGTFKDIHARIIDSALFVLSSDYEGMPNALMEAMALGIPCVTTDYAPGGAREVITSAGNGLIVEGKNPRALADGIEKMLGNYVQAMECGRRARKILQTHSMNTIMDMWEKCFFAIVKGN